MNVKQSGANDSYNNDEANNNDNQKFKTSSADISIPYIADAIALLFTAKEIQFDYSSPGGIIAIARQTIAIAGTMVLTDYMSKIAMDLIPQEIKDSYLDPICNNAYEACESVVTRAEDSLEQLKQMNGDIVEYFKHVMNDYGD